MESNKLGRDVPGLDRTITPDLPPQVMVLINAFVETHRQLPPVQLANQLRGLHRIWQHEGWSLKLRGVALVLADLLEQGWWVTPTDRTIRLEPPGELLEGESIEDAKTRLRGALRIGRSRQLAEPGVVAFLKRMHRPIKRGGQFTSINSLIDDGERLVPALRRCQMLSPEAAAAALGEVIQPIIQLCEESARCEHTGLRLIDVWRYFRHTWSLEYRSIPGRQMPLLIRNAAGPNHPVIGIAMLASPVVRTKPRDNWMGWTPEAFISRLLNPQATLDIKQALEALLVRLDRSLAEIRSDDFKLTSQELANPSFQTVLRLETRAGGAAQARRRQLEESYAGMMEVDGKPRSQRDPTRQSPAAANWYALSDDPLYIYKRADILWRLLAAKRVLLSLDWSKTGAILLADLLAHPEGERAIGTVLQEIRKAGLSSQVADLSVCGAVAPYNLLLGGKLVALLMASAEVRNLYRGRYSNQVSIISSQMAGRPIVRPAELKILTTTSLYGNGSSQYNRLHLRRNQFPALVQDIQWQKLEKTLGWGTYHLASETLRVLRQVSERAHGARRINNRFGEGASPRMRQTREGLAALGIDSTLVLHHATPRLFFGCELHSGAVDELIGLRSPTSGQGASADVISEAWRKRWLVSRIQQPGLLDRLAQSGPNTLRADMQTPDSSGQLELVLGAQ